MNSFLKRIFSGSIFLLMFWYLFFFNSLFFSLFIILILLEILIFEWKNFFNVYDYKFWLILPFYPILPFILIILLNNEVYRPLLFTFFVVVFCFDSGSYLFGKLFGKHKILPKISPGKTWQGLFGGILTSFISLSLIFFFQNKQIPIFFTICFSLIISLLAFLGDVFESYLKRKAGIKDSGNIMPGHGGFLDRFDGILFAVIFIYIFKEYLIRSV